MKRTRKDHTLGCICCVCKMIRGEIKGKNHPKGMLGKIHNKKIKKIISITSKKRWENSRYKRRVGKAISCGRLGMKFSKSHKENLKINHKGFTGKIMSKAQKQKISKTLRGHKGAKNQPKNVRHHIYKEENSDKIMYLKVSKHHSLHKRAYDFIFDKYGKKGIDNYLNWFDKKFGLK